MKTSVGTSCKRQKAKSKYQKAKGQHFFLFIFGKQVPPFCLLIFAFCPLISLLSACGKIGDPLPPIPRAPLTINELSVVQQGSRLILSFPITRPPRSERLQRIDIFRLIEPESAPLGMTQETFAERASVIATIPSEQVPVGSATITQVDPLVLTQQIRGLRYRYAVRLYNKDGRAADFSNYALITPLTDLAAAPTGLTSQLSQTDLVLTWVPPTANENGTRPANIAGYNLYRKTGDNLVRLNAQPLQEPRFVERAGKANLNEAIESNASEPLVFTPRDTFPPSAPTSITIASINAQVSLFWPANPEADLAGYNIYRAEDANAPTTQWIKLNARLHTPTTFRDDRVQVGKTYFYQVTAVDTAGNESARSETKSETVNP
jgi:hypothetical protein